MGRTILTATWSAKNLAAPHHQHFFTFRLDMDVDGPLPNRVVEMNSVPVPTGPTNPYGGAFQMQETELRTESEAQRNLDLATSRKWIVTNPSARNALGHPTGYALLPGENAVLFAQPDSWVRKRAAFLNSHVWVTPYQARRNVCGRRLSQPKPRRRRPAALDGGQPQHPQSGRGPVVQHGNHAQSAAGGLARDARPLRRLSASAVGILRPQSR